jgi:predicted dithiol-disulfide oxidoreductase (DUF899 family)
MTAPQKIVSQTEWLKARQDLLAQEKKFTRERDELSRQRREMPWLEVTKPYQFETPAGRKSFGDLFAGNSQLIVYHFMFHPDWTAGCKSCSYWADNYNGAIDHLAARDTALVAISRAPLGKLEAFRQRMGWRFPWASAIGEDFNHDFGVSFTKDEIASKEKLYNYGTRAFGGEDAPGISVFIKEASGRIFHTYSCYSRGLDMLNGAYHLLDLTPKGRDEEELTPHMAWVRLHDEYGKG